MSSKVNSIFDIAGAFDIAEEILGKGRQWNPTNPAQAQFLPMLEQAMPYVVALKAEGLLDAVVSWQAADVNKFFRDRKLTIELTQNPSPDVFYAGSVYEQLIKWLAPGNRDSVHGKDGKKYDAALLDDGLHFFFSREDHAQVANIYTQGSDTVYMAILEDLPQPGDDPFALMKLAQQIQKNLSHERGYDKLRFPMVNMDVVNDVDWMVEMWTNSATGQRARIIEAKQQSILKANHLGALARSGFGMAVALEMAVVPKETMTIDRPFLFWIDRPGMPLPMFTAWVDYTDWSDPGELTS